MAHLSPPFNTHIGLTVSHDLAGVTSNFMPHNLYFDFSPNGEKYNVYI